MPLSKDPLHIEVEYEWKLHFFGLFGIQISLFVSYVVFQVMSDDWPSCLCLKEDWVGMTKVPVKDIHGFFVF